MSEKTGQNDRVSYSFGMKLSLPEKYESVDFHINLSSDVKDGESTESAFLRVKAIVHDQAADKFSELRREGYGVVEDSAEKVLAPAKPVEKVVISKATQAMIKTAFLTMQERHGLNTEKFKKEFLGGRGLSTVPESEYDSIYATINKYMKSTK